MKEIKKRLDNIITEVETYISCSNGDMRIAMRSISELVTISRLLVEKIEQIGDWNEV